MPSTVYRSTINIRGSAAGHPNPIVYVGPTIDLTGPDSPITSDNTLKVWRINESTGAWESYIPGAGGNDFTTLDRGSLTGGTNPGKGRGRGYLIVAKADFLLNHCIPTA